MPSYSIVEYFADHDGYKCGYCKNATSAYSQGMWAHSLNVEDYQALIDRGWRRSGKYCYKPTMHKTCCPQYPIRCHARDLKFSKSKKKVAKRMQQFLINGGQSDIDKWKEYCMKRSRGTDEDHPCSDGFVNGGEENAASDLFVEEPVHKCQQDLATVLSTSPTSTSSPSAPNPERDNSAPQQVANQSAGKSTNNVTKQTRKGSGADPNKPPCRKAKQIRLERKLAKLQNKGNVGETTQRSNSQPQEKTLEDFLPHLNELHGAKHKLEVRLVSTSSHCREFQHTRQESLKLYQKYQMTIHNDTLDDCSEKQWTRFLVDTPLNTLSDGPGQGYGSFHNQYWLNDKLIAVGVVDVLPHCISSVYLYYDPDYGFLSLGMYSALSEIALTKELQKQSPAIEYYYMGFYIHSCLKMKYKGAYDPSELLCPETYMWTPLPKCIPTLSKQAYARLNVLNGGSPDAVDQECRMATLNAVRCLYSRSITDYGSYKFDKYFNRQGDHARRESERREEDARVEDYVSFVGSTCAKRMLLYRAQHGDH